MELSQTQPKQHSMFDFRVRKTWLEAVLFYLVCWGSAMLLCGLLTAPTVLFWGSNWQSSQEEYLKLAVTGTHAICAVLALGLGLWAAYQRGLQRSMWFVGMILGGAVLAGMFGGMPVALAATAISLMKPAQSDPAQP